ncbi:hypothetical protein EJ02DRAFT_356974 [Clathrospora elynae]|uniref:Uncharacterized protein n=1 Tax=Clathrospora elynae TaxID=706981 RepID=A0A6A5S9Y7_9PLEO|nr:hypothetical protein EJ02DRAFT_356974 [Clathrospora elynae]
MRKVIQLVTHPEDDTDSEIELLPSKSLTKKFARPASKPNMKLIVAHHADDSMFDAGDEEDSDNEQPKFSLVTPAMKRNQRILDPSKPEHAALIASATKVGTEYYDSDAQDVPGDVKDTSKPDLFRNVAWGSYATSYDNEAEFVKEPEFTQFVPGRFELLPDGTLRDQKSKLIIKLLDKAGRKRIFANPPPRDWASQEAITALNKRTVQQIRRNTNVRFREVVRAYVPEERRWILENLSSGKPTQGWKTFVEDFNKRFEGMKIAGAIGTRPYRSHSSLTKEVERFGADFYVKGLMPVTARKGKKE